MAMRVVNRRQCLSAGGRADGRNVFCRQISQMKMKSACSRMRSIDAQIGSGRKTTAQRYHGWKPESGFIKYRWEGYDEALLLYVLALGSPTHPLPESSYAAWASTYKWEHCCGQDYLYAGPLFTHQLSHVLGRFSRYSGRFMREKASIISKTAAAQLMRSNSTRSTTHSNSRAMAPVLGNYRGRWSRPRHYRSERH